jgi:hypothetical protein
MNPFHLAGIIPVAGQPLDFETPWPDALMPLAPNYLAVERCVAECAYAGCETIWIVCNDDIQPLIKHRLGDYASDPVWVYRHFDKYEREQQKTIPIYYVPISAHDRGQRDSLSWSALHGMYTADYVSRMMSRWLKPNMFYVSFPYGVYRVSFLREHRKTISTGDPFYLVDKNQTVADGKYLGFTISWQEAQRIRKRIWKESTLKNDKETGKRLPVEERFSARFNTVQETFHDVTTEKASYEPAPEYYPIDSWENYTEYAFLLGRDIRRPSDKILKSRNFKGIG